uniref:Uncharacterized protein n=1 Tax=Avena sativa TaxID=4498 RepID=A0ACD5VIL9_AVESA
MATDGRDRGSPSSAMGQGDQSAKKPRMDLLPNGSAVKQEVVVHDAAGGAFVAEVHGSRVEVTLKMDISVLHCPLCFCPLRPPVLKCKGGHLACGGCVAELPGSQCHRCEHGGGFDPEPAMDAVVAAARVECPHDGCGRFIPYYEASDHKTSCLHAPCCCTEPGCGFAAPLSALVAHLAAAHAMPVHRVPYGRPNRIQVPVPDPPRRLLAGDDGGVFLLTVGALGATTVVSVVCVRAEACALPRYTVKMWANGPPSGSAANRKTDTVLADVEAMGSSTPGAVALEDLTSYLVVPPRYLVGAAACKELLLHIRIEKNAS